MYELILTPKARRDLQRLDAKIQRQVLRKLERLLATNTTIKH